MINILLSFIALVLIVVPIFVVAVSLGDDIHDVLEDLFK